MLAVKRNVANLGQNLANLVAQYRGLGGLGHDALDMLWIRMQRRQLGRVIIGDKGQGESRVEAIRVPRYQMNQPRIVRSDKARASPPIHVAR